METTTSEILECGHHATPTEHTTGYGTTPDGRRHCYECIATMDKNRMIWDGKITLYFVKRDEKHFVTNWPGSLEFPVLNVKTSFHNMAGRNGRTDFWFKGPDGKTWHGYQIGQYNQIAHCKRTK